MARLIRERSGFDSIIAPQWSPPEFCNTIGQSADLGARPISTAPIPVSPRRDSYRWRLPLGLISTCLSDRTAPAGLFGRVGRRWLLAFWLSAPRSPSPVGEPWFWSCFLRLSKPGPSGSCDSYSNRYFPCNFQSTPTVSNSHRHWNSSISAVVCPSDFGNLSVFGSRIGPVFIIQRHPSEDWTQTPGMSPPGAERKGQRSRAVGFTSLREPKRTIQTGLETQVFIPNEPLTIQQLYPPSTRLRKISLFGIDMI